MKKKVNKFLPLIFAFVILLGAFSINAMAEETGKEYNIKIVFSQNITSKDDKRLIRVEKEKAHPFTAQEVTKAKAGTKLYLNNYERYQNHMYTFIDGKKASTGYFEMPNHDLTIYVDVFSLNESQIRPSSIKTKPESYVTVTFDAGEHGDFSYSDESEKTSKYYVPNYRKVRLQESVYKIERGFVAEKDELYSQAWDKPTWDVLITEDTTFNAKYLAKKFKFTFTNRDNKVFETDLPAQAKVSELAEFSNSARSEVKEGERFIGWFTKDKPNYDGFYSLYQALIPGEESELKPTSDLDYKEIVTDKHKVTMYYGSDGISPMNFALVENNGKVQKPSWAEKVYEITKLGSYDKNEYRKIEHQYNKDQEFDFDQPITRDINLVSIRKPSSPYRPPYIFKVVSDPKMVYNKNKDETTVDLSGLIIGIEESAEIKKYIPYSEFANEGITTDIKHGDSVKGIDKKHIKITKGDYFTFSNEPFDINDDNFDKENIKEITIAQQPQLKYKIDKNAGFNLDDLKVNINDKNGVIRKDIPYSDFKYYGLKVNLNYREVTSHREIEGTDDGKKFRVYFGFNYKVFAETEPIKVTTSIFNKDAKSVAFAEGTKTNYIVGEKLDLANLKAVLIDENENTKEVAYDKFGENKLTLAFEGGELDKNLAIGDSGKNLVLTLEGKEPVKLPISVVDFDINKVKEIAVKKDPKLQYESGDKLELKDLVVILKDENNRTKEVPFADFKYNYLTTSMENGTLITDQTGPITITYKNGDKTFEAKTKDLDVTVIELASENDKTNAKDAIEKLENLSSEEKKDFQDKVDVEKAKAKVNEIVDAAKAKDTENKKIKDAKELQEAKDKAKDEVNKLENIDEEAKKAANKNIDNAKSKEEVKKILEEAKKKDAEAKANKELEEAKAEEAAAKEKEKAAEKAKAEVDKVKAEADAKAAEAEKAKEEADTKAKEAEEAAKAAKEAANAETDQVKKKDLERKAEVAAEAAKAAKAEVKTAKKNEEEAKATAEEAKEAVAEAENELEKARLEVKQAEEKVKEKQKAVDEFKKKPETPDNPKPQPQPQPQPETEQKPEPSEPGYNYNPFWFGYFVSNAKTDNKTDAKSGIATPVKLDSKVAIGSKTLKVTVNGVERKVEMDVAPFIANNRTMLPIRFVAEALGFKVEWDEPSRAVILTDKDNVVKIPVDTNKIIVNGNEYESDAKPILRNNRTTLPIANVARALGLVDGKDIIWDAATRTVVIKREIEK